MSPEEVGAGVVTGGWSFVTLSYFAAWALLGGYAVLLSRRLRAAQESGGPP